MTDETPPGSAGTTDGRGHPRGSPGEQSPLQARAQFLKNRSWELVVRLNRGACERGRAQHGQNSESYATLEAEWNRRQGESSTLDETIEFLRRCHRTAPFAANASLYALCAAVICSLGYVPSLGFVHDAGTLPFVYDVADLYKHLTSIPAAFMAVRQDSKDEGELVRKLLKQRVEEERLLQRMPKDLAALFQTAEAQPIQAGARPPSAL